MKKKFDNETIELFIFRHFNNRNFEILKCRSFYISSFQISTATPVGGQISEDVSVPGEVLVAEGIRVPEDIRVPESFGYSTEKN